MCVPDAAGAVYRPLLEIVPVEEFPPLTPDAGTIDLVKAALPGRIPPGWLLRIQQTVVLADSQPEPDFAVVRGTPRTYLARYPVPADVGLMPTDTGPATVTLALALLVVLALLTAFTVWLPVAAGAV